VVYESKHRILKFLEEIRVMVNGQGLMVNKEERQEKKPDLKFKVSTIVVCREISKMHETVYRGSVEDIIKKIKSSGNDQKGEFVVIVGK
jgi:16S rRNA (cytidine1402-2'-O)-methyltransferase